MLGVHISQEYEEQVRRSIEDAAKARDSRRRMRKENDRMNRINGINEESEVSHGVRWKIL
jgi:hypothetical protein